MTEQDPEMTLHEDLHEAGRTAELGDPRVARARMTGSHGPEQYEGELVDGRWFYFRYRCGWASVGVGATLDEAIDHSGDHELKCGGQYDGEWPDRQKRDQVFAVLLTAAMADRVLPSALGDLLLTRSPEMRGEWLNRLGRHEGHGVDDLAHELTQLRKRAGMGGSATWTTL